MQVKARVLLQEVNFVLQAKALQEMRWFKVVVEQQQQKIALFNQQPMS